MPQSDNIIHVDLDKCWMFMVTGHRKSTNQWYPGFCPGLAAAWLSCHLSQHWTSFQLDCVWQAWVSRMWPQPDLWMPASFWTNWCWHIASLLWTQTDQYESAKASNIVKKILTGLTQYTMTPELASPLESEMFTNPPVALRIASLALCKWNKQKQNSVLIRARRHQHGAP